MSTTGSRHIRRTVQLPWRPPRRTHRKRSLDESVAANLGQHRVTAPRMLSPVRSEPVLSMVIPSPERLVIASTPPTDNDDDIDNDDDVYIINMDKYPPPRQPSPSSSLMKLLLPLPHNGGVGIPKPVLKFNSVNALDVHFVESVWGGGGIMTTWGNQLVLSLQAPPLRVGRCPILSRGEHKRVRSMWNENPVYKVDLIIDKESGELSEEFVKWCHAFDRRLLEFVCSNKTVQDKLCNSDVIISEKQWAAQQRNLIQQTAASLFADEGEWCVRMASTEAPFIADEKTRAIITDPSVLEDYLVNEEDTLVAVFTAGAYVVPGDDILDVEFGGRMHLEGFHVSARGEYSKSVPQWMVHSWSPSAVEGIKTQENSPQVEGGDAFLGYGMFSVV